MQKQVGILIMKDENDILEEYLTKVSKFFDKILVLDGSDDNQGQEICSKFPEVIFYEKDQNVIDVSNDSTTRGFLWEKAKKLVTDKQWVGILHPDEFPEGDLLTMFEKHSHSEYDVIAVYNRHYFLHSSQRETWNFLPGTTIEDKMFWYMAPGHCEDRYFRFNDSLVYGKHHSTTMPLNVGPTVFDDTVYHKQFTYRSRDQVMKRALSRWNSGWQQDDYCLVLETGDIFFDTLKYPEEYQIKYPQQYNRCWYNHQYAYVGKDE